MDSELRRMIKETAVELGITELQATHIWTATGMVIREMMSEGNPRYPDTYKRIFLRNIGTYHVRETTKFALKKQWERYENI